MGGTVLVRCLQPRSGNTAFIVDPIRTGAGTLMRCSHGVTARHVIYGVLSITEVYATKRRDSRAALEVFADLMARHGVPRYSRFDKGPEMIAKVLRRGLKRLGSETIYITPGRPWENGYCESFNGRLRDE